MRKITLFAMLLVGILAARAEYAFVGTYTGVIELEHLMGDPATMENQSVTISEVDGKVNVTFPSFMTMTNMETGEITIEDVTVTDNNDGTFDLSKETFTVGSGYVTYPYSTFSASISAEGIGMMVEVIQNPEMGALTTAYFYYEPEDLSAVVGEYKGNLNLTHVDGTEVAVEGEQSVTVAEVDGKINVTFPSFTLVTNASTGEITIEDVTVTDNGDGSYSLSKEAFTVATVFSGSAFSGTINNGSVEMTIKVAQNPAMVMTTANFSTGGNEEEPGDEPADPSVFEWGTATWNTEDGVVYDDLAAFEAAGLTLSYPNPTGFALSFLNVLAVEFDLYIDDAETPEKASSSAQGNTEVVISYPFVEGHSYKIVTTGAVLAQANLATYTTDTLTTDATSYEISFTINGPELVKTIEVENWMSLAITNQEYTKTVSKVDPSEICAALGINDISEADMHALRPNGAYCDYMSYFDWWRDADGDFTTYNSGYNSVFGHNAYPAVYSIKVNEAADSVTYYFYDYWKEIVEGEGNTSGGSTLTRAPQTVYSNDTVQWDNGDGTFTPYRRSYRVEEGKDYVSEVMYVANRKSVILRATLHFVSVEEWEEITAIEAPAQVAAEAVEYYSIAGVRQPSLQKGINIVRYADGTTRKVMVK